MVYIRRKLIIIYEITKIYSNESYGGGDVAFCYFSNPHDQLI
jgi:hypothetical protein